MKGSAIQLTETGGPEVLKIAENGPTEPGSGQAWVEHGAIGVNYLDVTQRNGALPIKLPSGLGLEGAGRVTAVGPDVKNVAADVRVGYALGPLGSYATGRLIQRNALSSFRTPSDPRSRPPSSSKTSRCNTSSKARSL
jgi:NADPH:quinone reductase